MSRGLYKFYAVTSVSQGGGNSRSFLDLGISQQLGSGTSFKGASVAEQQASGEGEANDRLRRKYSKHKIGGAGTLHLDKKSFTLGLVVVTEGPAEESEKEED